MEAPIDAKTLADKVLAAVLDKKAFDPLLLDVADAVGYADYFVIVSGRSPRQVRAIAEAARSALKAEGVLPLGIEGRETGRWVLVDFDDVILHVFHEQSRPFYDLEDLYHSVPRLGVPEAAPAQVVDDADDDEDAWDEDDAPLFSFPDA